jgi:hypothetical protein
MVRILKQFWQELKQQRLFRLERPEQKEQQYQFHNPEHLNKYQNIQDCQENQMSNHLHQFLFPKNPISPMHQKSQVFRQQNQM